MLVDKKFRVLLVFFTVSLLGNLVLAYFLIDNAMTASFLEMDKARCQRERMDSIQYLNLTIKNSRDFDFFELNKIFLGRNDSLFKPQEEGYTVLGELCFTKIKETYKVSYCSDVFNKR